MNGSKITAKLERLEQLNREKPNSSKEHKSWLAQKELVRFLKENIRDDDIVLYASLGNPGSSIYIYGILVPSENLNPRDEEDLLQWSCNPTQQWGMRGLSEEDYTICPPFDSLLPKCLNNSTQLLFLRRFEAKIINKRYIEISETLLQPHDLHFMNESNSYCTFDENGDVKQAIKVLCSDNQALTLVTINKETLKKHLNITKCSLVRFFESRRIPEINNLSRDNLNQKRITQKSICYNYTCFDNTQSMIRGFQIIERNDVKIKKQNRAKKYETFLADDFKNKKVKKISCNPANLASYFEPSNLPFETTPVFFNASVLTRYKSDPDKYRLTESMIVCRSAWCLEHYHINEANQVFTYIIYLSRLPYKEQQYWKHFNERPNGGISQSALLTDFKGEFDFSYEPMQSIKSFLKSNTGKNARAWKLKDPDLINQLHYPITDGRKEWADSIETLNKIVNEGFDIAKLKLLLKKADTAYTEKDGSLNLIKIYITKINNNLITQIHEPLKNLNELRTKCAAHTEGDGSKKIRMELIKKHGTLCAHFKDLLKRCDIALRALFKMIDVELQKNP